MENIYWIFLALPSSSGVPCTGDSELLAYLYDLRTIISRLLLRISNSGLSSVLEVIILFLILIDRYRDVLIIYLVLIA